MSEHQVQFNNQGDAVAEIVSAHGDPEAFGERELVALVDIQKLPYGTKLYAWNNRPSLANGRWRVFECVFDRTHFGIELEEASDDDDPILYSMKIKRETVQAIVDAHNASVEPHPPTN